MIRVIVIQGKGDKKLGIITDPLICEPWMAYARARQELILHRAIMSNKDITIPCEPTRECGDVSEVNFPKLGITGPNEVLSVKTNISAAGIVGESVTVRQIKGFVP